MKIVFLIPLLVLPACSESEASTQRAAQVLSLTPVETDLGKVPYPSEQKGAYTVKNITDRPVNITQVYGSCVCQSFLLDGKRVANGRDINVPLEPGEELAISFAFQVKPLGQEMRIGVRAGNRGFANTAGLKCYGVAPIEVRPADHHFGVVVKGTRHKWKTRVIATEDVPFELTSSDARVTLERLDGGTLWTLSGELHADQEGTNAVNHTVATNIKNIPSVSVIVSAEVQRQVELPPILNIAVRDNVVDYEFSPVIHSDSNIRVKACHFDPRLDGLKATTDGTTVFIKGNPTIGRLARVHLVLSFSGADYPDARIRVLLLKR